MSKKIRRKHELKNRLKYQDGGKGTVYIWKPLKVLDCERAVPVRERFIAKYRSGILQLSVQ